MSSDTQPRPTEEDLDEALLSCRYGEQEEVEAFVAAHGVGSLAAARDGSGNSCLHMVAANGHLGQQQIPSFSPLAVRSRAHSSTAGPCCVPELLTFLLPLVPATLFSAPNQAGSTPLHWASLNGHLPIVRALVLHPLSPGDSLIDLKNAAGRTPVGEAEMMERLEVASWLVGRMLLDDGKGGQSEAAKEDDEAVEETREGDGEEEVEQELFKMKLEEDGSVKISPIDGEKP